MAAHKLKLLVILALPLITTQKVRAIQQPATDTEASHLQNQDLLSYKCPSELPGKDGYNVYVTLQYSQNFFEVRTQRDPLKLRATPGGRVIGAIPKGWQVYVAKYDPSRRWAYVRDSKGFYHPDYGLASAPDFRSDGWVSVDYLVPLGEYCAKPNELALLPPELPLGLSGEKLSKTIWQTLETELLDKLNRS